MGVGWTRPASVGLVRLIMGDDLLPGDLPRRGRAQNGAGRAGRPGRGGAGVSTFSMGPSGRPTGGHGRVAGAPEPGRVLLRPGPGSRPARRLTPSIDVSRWLVSPPLTVRHRRVVHRWRVVAGREGRGRSYVGSSPGEATPAVGVRVWTHGFGADAPAGHPPRQPGVIIMDCGERYTTVRGADGTPLVRRWAVALDTGLLVFRHPPDLECDSTTG